MLRAIINGQSSIKSELLGRIGKLENKIDKLETKVDKNDANLFTKITEVEKNITKRIDKLGLQIASLEDDSPTRVSLITWKEELPR